MVCEVRSRSSYCRVRQPPLTVFVIGFWDACHYVGVTDMGILDAVDELVASPFLDHGGARSFLITAARWATW